MSVRKRGKQKKIDKSLMAMWALLLVRTHGAKPTPAARAAIRAWGTWTEHPHPDLLVEPYLEGVLKKLQRLESGEAALNPALTDLMGWADKSTGAPIFGTRKELAQSIAQFLPKE